MERNFILGTVIFLASLFPTAPTHADDITIPILVGKTGASAVFGQNESDAYTLAAEEWNSRGGVNGRKIALDFDDTQTSGKQIVTAFQRFAANGASVVMGPTWLDGFPAVINSARKSNVLLVTPSAAIESFSASDRDWPITFYHNSTTEVQVLLTSLQARGFTKISLIYEQEPFAEMIRALMLAQKISLVSDLGIQSGSGDFQSHLVKLKREQPSALIILVWSERSLLSLLQQLRTHLPHLPLATVHDGAGWLQNPTFQPVLPKLIHSEFVIPDSSFAEKFKSRFGYPPILTASNAYDALNAVLQSMQAGARNSDEIRSFIRSSELTTTTFGKFRFAADGSVPSRVVVVDGEPTQAHN